MREKDLRYSLRTHHNEQDRFMKLTVDQAIQKAIQTHNKGKIHQANQIYREILKVQPNHPYANHNLGVIAFGIGKIKESLSFLKVALNYDPGNAQFWHSYIDVLMKLEQTGGDETTQEAITIASLEQAKTTNIRNPPPGKLRKLLDLYNRGELETALEKSEILVKEFPKSAILLNIQGTILNELGDLNLSAKTYRVAVTIDPDFVEAYKNLGLTLQAQGKLTTAVVCYNRALFLDQNQADIYFNLANAHNAQGKLNLALIAYENALKLNPAFHEAANNIGIVMQKLGRLEGAIDLFNKAISLKNDYAEAYNNKGVALKEFGKIIDAIEAFNTALDVNPNYVGALNNLGNALKLLGKPEEAMSSYQRALKVDPYNAEVHRQISLIKKYTREDPQIKTVSTLLDYSELDDYSRCHLSYAYAKMNEDIGDIESALSHYIRGGKLCQKLHSYNFEQDIKLFNAIKTTSSQLTHLSLDNNRNYDNFIPVFIVGMPRSGTSLVEQIMSSHSRVTGAGELPYVAQFGTDLIVGNTTPRSDEILEFRHNYLSKIERRASNTKLVIDKMPHNFRYLGLICAALPEAKIVHVKRDAKATCWSNFKHYFQSKGLGYSFDLLDTVNYYRMYEELMYFWGEVFGERIYTLDYESLTLNQEIDSRCLIDFLGLSWENSCLEPENNMRPVLTASSQQVRRKLYRNSASNWRKYEPFIGGIFNKLNP